MSEATNKNRNTKKTSSANASESKGKDRSDKENTTLKSRTWGLNKTIVIGRLGFDPELKSGTKSDYTIFSLCNSTIVDGKENVQWHRICAFGKQAQLCHQYLRKGDLCCVEGRIDCKTYDSDGGPRTMHSIVAERVVFLSSKRRQNQNQKRNDDISDSNDAETCAE